jgi:hypothetical protein
MGVRAAINQDYNKVIELVKYKNKSGHLFDPLSRPRSDGGGAVLILFWIAFSLEFSWMATGMSLLLRARDQDPAQPHRPYKAKAAEP